MATVNANTVVTGITITLTLEEADLLAELIDGEAEELRSARLKNYWLYNLIKDIDAAAGE